jgi:hypothetical protein
LTATTYAGILPGMIVLGVGAGLTIPSATESAMGSLPSGHTSVGSATNGAFLQIGGALGTTVIGSRLNTRQDRTAVSDHTALSHAKDPLGQASLASPGDHFGGEPRYEADKHGSGTCGERAGDRRRALIRDLAQRRLPRQRAEPGQGRA